MTYGKKGINKKKEKIIVRELRFNLLNLCVRVMKLARKNNLFMLNLYLTYIGKIKGPKNSSDALGHRPTHVDGHSSPSLHT